MPEKMNLPWTCLVTDIIMPDMSGRDLIDQLRKMGCDLKVLYMSGYTDNAIIDRGFLEEGVYFGQ